MSLYMNWYYYNMIHVQKTCYLPWYMSKKTRHYHGTCPEKHAIYHGTRQNRVLPWYVSKKARHYHGTCPKMWYYHGSCLNKNNILWHMSKKMVLQWCLS